MDEIGDYNLFVGGLSGVFKGVRVTYLKGIHNVKNLQNVKEIVKRNELTVLNWGDDEETEILMGYANQQVRIYDLHSKRFVFDEVLRYGEGSICGISKYNGHLLTGIGSGSVCVWNSEDLKNPTSIMNTGVNLDRVRHSRVDKNIVAAGGKENDLSLWNLETQQRVFLAKNVRHDELELRVPVWISDICFVPDTEKKVAVCSRHGHVRMYDPTTQQRRPVVQVEIKDQALMCIAAAPRDHHVVVGSGTGHMFLVDLRNKGVLLNHYKGFVGGIRQIVCTPSEPYIASVGLDRHLRIHNLNTKQLLHKEYLQSRLSCILAKSSFTMSPHQIDLKEDSEFKQEAESVVDGSDEEYESMFDKMDVIVDEEKKPKKEKNNNSGAVTAEDGDLVEDKKISEKKNKFKHNRKNKNEHSANSVKDTLTSAHSVKDTLTEDVTDESDSETEIVKEVSAEKTKNFKNSRKNEIDYNLSDAKGKKTNTFRVEQVETGDKNDIQMEIIKQFVTDGKKTAASTSKDRNEGTEIIEIGDNENIVQSDEEVETLKVISAGKNLSSVDFEDEDSDVIEIDDEDEGGNDVEVKAIKEIIVHNKAKICDTDDIEDDDSDIIEIDYNERREKSTPPFHVRVEVDHMKEITRTNNTSASDWAFDEWNQSSHGADGGEDDDSDIIEIENERVVDVENMEVEEQVTNNEEVKKKGKNEPQCCRTGDMKDGKTVVTGVNEEKGNISLEEETVENVDTDITNTSSGKGQNKQKQNIDKVESVVDCLEEKEDKIENESQCKPVDMEDEMTDVSEVEYQVENRSDEKNLTKVDTNVKSKSSKKGKKKRNQSMDSATSVENDCLKEKENSNNIENEPQCKPSDMKNEMTNVAGVEVHTRNSSEEETTKKGMKNKNNKKGRNKRNESNDNAKSQENDCLEEEDCDKIEISSEVKRDTKTVTDIVPDDSKKRMSNESLVAEKKTPRKKKSKNEDSPKIIFVKQDSNHRSLRSGNKKNDETDSPKTKRRRNI